MNVSSNQSTLTKTQNLDDDGDIPVSDDGDEDEHNKFTTYNNKIFSETKTFQETSKNSNISTSLSKLSLDPPSS